MKEVRSVRRATPEDIDALASMERAVFRGAYRAHQWSRSEFQTRFRSQATLTAVLVDAHNKPLGYVAGRLKWRKATIYCDVESLAVRPVARRKGVGRELMRWLIQEAKRAGCRELYLEVHNKRLTARSLFASLGFVERETLPNYYGDRYNAKRMRLAL